MSIIDSNDNPVDLEACEVCSQASTVDTSSDKSYQEHNQEEQSSKRPTWFLATAFVSSLLFIMILAALTLSKENNGSYSNVPSSSQSRHQRLGSNSGSTSSSYEQDDMLRVQLSYHSELGQQKAEACAQLMIENRDDNNELVMLASRKCLMELELESEIEQIEEDFPVEGQSADDLPSMGRRNLDLTPWGISMIQADSMETGSDANETIVCIADTGIAIDHPDFDPEYITGEDTVFPSGEVWKWNEDKSGHGTHVAGTIAATQENGIGITGAGRIRLHIVRALDDQAKGYESDMRRAINSCVEAGAKIINLSLGMRAMSSTTEQLLDHVVDDLGVLVIAASGNSGLNEKFYPASHPKVISVAAVKDNGDRWSRSTMSDQVELSAPGYKVMSTTVSSSAVQTDDFAYKAKYLEGSSHEPVTGTLKDCGNGSNQCPRNRNGICLLRLESVNSEDVDAMLDRCSSSRATGAIIYNSLGNSYNNWVQHTTLSVVVVPRYVGESLLSSNLGDDVTIGDVNADEIEYAYAEMSGTSMAAPHVAAAAALVWSHFGSTCSNHQIRYALAHSAFNPDATEEVKCDQNYGHGWSRLRMPTTFFLRMTARHGMLLS